jgi:hypothetical protein
VATIETFITLCVYPPDRNAYLTVEKCASVSPTKMTERDGVFSWLWSSEKLSSDDIEDHVVYISRLIEDAGLDFDVLRSLGYKMWLSCYWNSMSLISGPTLNPKTIKILYDLNLSLGFDVWFSFEN